MQNGLKLFLDFTYYFEVLFFVALGIAGLTHSKRLAKPRGQQKSQNVQTAARWSILLCRGPFYQSNSYQSYRTVETKKNAQFFSKHVCRTIHKKVDRFEEQRFFPAKIDNTMTIRTKIDAAITIRIKIDTAITI